MTTRIDFNNEEEYEEFLDINEWNRLCMDFCIRSSSISKCAARKVSSIIADKDSIYSLGVNGTFPGKLNCNDIFKKEDGVWYIKDINEETNLLEWMKCEDQESHHKWSLLNEVHAEINALSKMNKKGISTKNLDLYCTHSPCYNCAKSIIAAGIKNVYYNELYDGYEDVMDLLTSNGINFIKIEVGE
ncbi:dCMP deaminase [Staphylococcus phage vB_StaM_SA1]|nr:dCMP deaminase [Staphylococcus phage vB_StaM_SA1]